MGRRSAITFAILIIVATQAACQGLGSSGATPSAVPATSAAQATLPAGATAASGAIRFTVAADGTQARYRVREQLAQLSFPSDAIGKTSAVTGTLLINSDGTLVADQSKFVVDLTGLQSDKGQRDRFVQHNLLDTSQYPDAEFDPTGISGLASPLPTSGPLKFQISGNLTAHGTTKPATWDVTGQILNSHEMTGTASTSFTFEDYNIPQPRVPVVLSVVDKITLELDFHLVKAQ